ncbi:AAA family ATPase [Synechococcus lacustris]|uniref:AAA family ATPase n=1 Tax=Synechococcus lacustris TaxID=2116544 RepID=UPI0020CD5B8E|nr:hypothetical protein [Synechococcus lacustris]MCP9813996.1 hypothetical protein [Synechococcus lacustris L1E-Slac]
MLPLGPLTLVCGANGCGKSNLYRALGLVAAAARGDLVATLAAEGGLPAVFWAGPERGSQGARLRLGFAGETLSYAIELGYGVEDQTSAFLLDPEIKREWIWAGGPFHPRSVLVQRNGAVVERCGNSQTPLALEVSPHESLFTAVSDPLEAPEVFQPHRSPGAGAALAPRHPHAIVGGRWRRSFLTVTDRNRIWTARSFHIDNCKPDSSFCGWYLLGHDLKHLSALKLNHIAIDPLTMHIEDGLFSEVCHG